MHGVSSAGSTVVVAVFLSGCCLSLWVLVGDFLLLFIFEAAAP